MAMSYGVAGSTGVLARGTVNAEVGVFLAYASTTDVAFIDRTLYLLRKLIGDRKRRAEAGIPKTAHMGARVTTKRRSHVTMGTSMGTSACTLRRQSGEPSGDSAERPISARVQPPFPSFVPPIPVGAARDTGADGTQ